MMKSNQWMGQMETMMGQMETKMGQMETMMGQMDATNRQMEARMGQIEATIRQIDVKSDVGFNDHIRSILVPIVKYIPGHPTMELRGRFLFDQQEYDIGMPPPKVGCH